jgi:hypothetical protein
MLNLLFAGAATYCLQEAGVAVYKAELVKKILRMAESEHDGEAAAAMRKLTAMAKEQGHNLDEMMAHVYGNGSASESSRPSGRYRDPFEDLFRQARRAQAAAAEARREREEAEAQAQRDREQRAREREASNRAERRAAESDARRARTGGFNPGGFNPGGFKWDSSPWAFQGEPPPWANKGESAGGRRFFEPLLMSVQEMVDLWGIGPLTPWEQSFVTDILSRGMNYRTTPAQDDVLRKIHEKYQRHATRNGDEKGFWGR